MKAFEKGKWYTLCPTANWSICVLHLDHTCPVSNWLHSAFILPCPFSFWNDRITCGIETGLKINNTLKRCTVWDLRKGVCLADWAWQLTVQINPDIIGETGLQPMLFLAAGLLVSILNLWSHPHPLPTSVALYWNLSRYWATILHSELSRAVESSTCRVPCVWQAAALSCYELSKQVSAAKFFQVNEELSCFLETFCWIWMCEIFDSLRTADKDATLLVVQ
jgi:hypothetical protein